MGIMGEQIQLRKIKQPAYKKGVLKKMRENYEYIIMALPVVLYLFIFNYIPIGGLVLAFKDYRYDKGILGSKWVGFKNFEFFFKTDAALRVTLNTLKYNVALILIGIIVYMIVALLLNEIRNKLAIKFYQTVMFFPHFMSWVIVAFVVYAFLSPSYGMLNRMFDIFGIKNIEWFTKPGYWPYILITSGIWKYMGYSVLINYAVLVGIDSNYYEAAIVDGASKLKMVWHISIPFLMPITIIQFILSVGRIFNSDFGLFYQVPQNTPLLYNVTDVIDTYIFRVLMDQNDIGTSTAVGLFQSIIGMVLVLLTNKIVKSIKEDSALF